VSGEQSQQPWASMFVKLTSSFWTLRRSLTKKKPYNFGYWMFSQNFLAETKLQPLEEHLHFQRFYDTAELLEGFKNVVGLEVVSDG